jgi:hypothetical protein
MRAEQQGDAYLGVLAVDSLGTDDCRVGHDGGSNNCLDLLHFLYPPPCDLWTWIRILDSRSSTFNGNVAVNVARNVPTSGTNGRYRRKRTWVTQTTGLLLPSAPFSLHWAISHYVLQNHNPLERGYLWR